MATLEMIHRGGSPRVLGCLPRSVAPGKLQGVPLHADKFTLIDQKDWQPLSTPAAIKDFVDRCIDTQLGGVNPDDEDQDGIGSCGAHSCTIAVMFRRGQQGLGYKRLAAGRLYHYSGGGGDSGSTLSDNLQYAMQLGIPELTSEKQNLDYRSAWTAAEKASAARNKILEACDCPSFDALASALQLDWDVQHGIMVGRNYDVDSSGLWINPPSGSGGGHAQMSPAGALCYDAAHGWGLLTIGSWGSQFGYRGCYIIPRAYFDRTVFNDGWAVRSVTTPSDDPAPAIV